MGFLRKFFNKPFFKGWFYVVDLPTLKTYLEQCGRFAQEEKLELGANFYVLDSFGKHRLMVCNPAASADADGKGDGLLFIYDGVEYTSLEMLTIQKLQFLPPHFKIHLEDGDDVFLNEYKARHPEVKEADF